MARYSIFTQFNEDDDDEGKKPSQIASEEQKKKRYEIFSQFNEPFVAPKRPEKKPEPEPVEEKKFLEKAKEKTKTFFGKAGEFAKKTFEKVKAWDPAYDVQKGVFGEEVEKTEAGRPTSVPWTDDEYVSRVGTIRAFREQAVRQLDEAEQARREYYGKGPKQINTAVEKRVAAAKWMIEDYDQTIGDERANRGFFVELFKSLQKNGLTPDYYEKFIATKQGEAVLKYKNGEELTGEEQMYVNSFRAKSYNALVDKGVAPLVAEVTAGIPRYAMLIWATSKAVDPFTESAQLAVLSKIPPGLAQTVVSKILGNSIKLGIAANLNIPGIEAKTAEYMLPIVDYERALETDDILSYLKPGDAPMEAYRKAYLTNLVEYVSEGAGGYIDDAVPFFKKAVVGKWLTDKGLDATNPSIVKTVLNATNFNSLLSEVFEEEIAEPLQAYIEGREYNDPLFTPEGRERLLVETLGIAAFSGMSKVSDSVIDKATSRRGSNNDVISIPVDATADVVPPGERKEQELPSEIEEELAPKESKEAVEDLRKYMLTEKSLIPEKTIDKLKEMKIGVSEMEFDDDGMITLYREGEITPGKPNSFSLSKKVNQKEYQINKDDILINTTSGELADLFSKTYEGKEKDLYLETLEKWNTLEAEVIAIPSDVAEGGVGDIEADILKNADTPKVWHDLMDKTKFRGDSSDFIKKINKLVEEGKIKEVDIVPKGTTKAQLLKNPELIKKGYVAQPPITDISKLPVKEQFKVGDVLNTKGRTNMVSPIKIREIEGNTLKFTDAKGTDYAGMSRSTVRNLIKEGAWSISRVAQPPVTKKAPVTPKPTKEPPKVTKKPKEVAPKAVEKKGRRLTLKPSQVEPEKAGEEVMGLGIKLPTVKFKRDGGVSGYKKPTITKTDLRTILKSSDEFRTRPILTVELEDDIKYLTYVGKKTQFKINPDAMNLSADNLKVGDKLFVDEEAIKAGGKTQQMRVYSGSKAVASMDKFADIRNLTEQAKEFKVVEFPELLRIAKELTGETPAVKRPRFRPSMGGYPAGLFVPGGKGKIVLNPRIFKDSSQAAKTFAHEIGHLADYIPDRTMKRGNLIARIASLNRHLKSYFAGNEKQGIIDDLTKKRIGLTEKRKGTIGEENKSIYKEIVALNKQIGKLKKKPKLENKPLMEELKNLTKLWKPFQKRERMINANTGKVETVMTEIDESEVPDNYLKYRYSPVELYADALSVLFNDPNMLRKEAPLFWKGFFEFLSAKPEFEKNLRETWNLLNQGEEAVFKARDEEMTKGFEKSEEVFVAKELEKKKRGTSLMYQLQLLFDDKNTPVIRKLRAAQKAGEMIEAKDNPEFALHGLNYTDGKLKNYVNDNFQPVFAKAQSVNDGWNTLGKILFYERVINERGELANPQGYDPKTAQNQLDMMEEHAPKEEWKTLQEAKEKFREAVKKSVDKAERNKFYTPELLKQMKMNPAYATYQVIDYLDTYISSRVYQSVGTLKDIANPATSTVMKLISVEKAIERNNAKKLNIRFFEKSFHEEVVPAKTKWNGKYMEVKDPSDPDTGLVITIENGRPQGYYMSKDIADNLNYSSNKTINAFARISRTLSQSKLYRPLFTSFNLGFQSFNFVRDFNRYWKNVPDKNIGEALTSFPRAIYRYAQAAPHAAKRALNIKDDMIRDMENSKIIGLTYNDMFKTKEVDEHRPQIERVLERAGVLQNTKRKNLFTPFHWVLSSVEAMGNFIETLPKVAGYIELKDKMPEEQLAEFIRTSVGSPDFRISGLASAITNNIFLFSNAIKEGIKSDARIAFTKNQSRAGFWWKTVAANFLPKIIMAGIAYGLFGDELKELMDKASEYDKTNYTIIPLYKDENGKAVYLRVPQDETGRLLGGLLWKTMTISGDRKLANDIFDIFSFGAGQFPNLSPAFTGAGALITYLSGKNPYDSYRGRNVIPDKEFAAGPEYSFPIMLKWLAKNQGAGIFFPTDYNYYNEKETALQKTLMIPVLSNIIGRWIKVSNYGETEKLREIKEPVEQARARRLLEERNKLDAAIEEYRSGTMNTTRKMKIERQLVKDVVGKGPYKGTDKTKATNTKNKFRIGILRGEADPTINAVISSTSNEEKITLLKEVEKTMSAKEFRALIKKLKDNKVISENVTKELR